MRNGLGNIGQVLAIHQHTDGPNTGYSEAPTVREEAGNIHGQALSSSLRQFHAT